MRIESSNRDIRRGSAAQERVAGKLKGGGDMTQRHSRVETAGEARGEIRAHRTVL